MKQELVLEQKQVLKLSQEMKLSLRILEMSQQELLEYWKGYLDGIHLSLEEEFLEGIIAEKNFYQHLEEQVLYLNVSKKQKEDILYCIYNLNSSGYLMLSDEELKFQRKLNEKELKELYTFLYRLEPIGIGAHNLQESLSLQLKFRGIWDEKYESLLQNLEEIAEGNVEEVCFKNSLSKDEYLDRFLEIKKCNPRLTRGFSTGKVCHIIPDFFVYQENDSYRIEENSSLQNNLYRINMRESRELDLLRRCIERRAETLRKILSYVLEKQQNYLFFSEQKKTLHEEEIASYYGLHISTISRAIQNKYIQYNNKIFAFKSLFCYSEEREKIKNILQFLLKNENKKKPYSDEALVRIFETEYQTKIARRTVAKYREELGYLSSYRRKI